MDLSFIFAIILILLVYTLYWTYFNDYGLFLFVILLLLSGLFIYQFVSEKIIHFENKLFDYENKIENIINKQILKLKNIKSNIFN